MTRLQHLTALRDKVKAGEFKTGPYSHAQKALGREHTRLAHSAFNGSVNAFLALAKSAAPNWYIRSIIQRSAELWEVSIWPEGKSVWKCSICFGKSDCPAEAGLLAILEALISQEGGE